MVSARVKILSLFFAAVIGATFIACAQKTTRKGLKTEGVKNTVTEFNALDTLRLPGDMLLITGYEKPLASRKESFHVTNATGANVVEIDAEIKYLDYRNQELHKRVAKIKCDIPVGATRMVSFPSWDVQNRFYFDGGPAPKREAYPYHVTITIKEAIVAEEL